MDCNRINGVVALQKTETPSVPETCSAGTDTENALVLVTSPYGVETVIDPSITSGGTVAMSRRSMVEDTPLVNVEGTPLNNTAVAPVKFVPKSVIVLPGSAPFGLHSATVNAGGGVGYHLNVNRPIYPCTGPQYVCPATHTK